MRIRQSRKIPQHNKYWASLIITSDQIYEGYPYLNFRFDFFRAERECPRVARVYITLGQSVVHKRLSQRPTDHKIIDKRSYFPQFVSEKSNPFTLEFPPDFWIRPIRKEIDLRSYFIQICPKKVIDFRSYFPQISETDQHFFGTKQHFERDFFFKF